MLKMSYLKIFYFLRYAQLRYVKRLFTNIQKQQKLAYFLRNLTTSRENNSRIIEIKNVKFSGYCFYMNTNVQEDFQICFSVPLIRDNEMYNRTLLIAQAYKNRQKQPTSHSYTELNKTQFFPVSIVKGTLMQI